MQMNGVFVATAVVWEQAVSLALNHGEKRVRIGPRFSVDGPAIVAAPASPRCGGDVDGTGAPRRANRSGAFRASGARFDLSLRSAVHVAGAEQAMPMDRRGRVERVLYEHLDVLSAPEAQDGFEDGRGIAEGLSGPSFVEFVEAWRCLEVNDVSLTRRVDQAGYRQPTSATRSFALAETRIQCGHRSDNARPQR